MSDSKDSSSPTDRAMVVSSSQCHHIPCYSVLEHHMRNGKIPAIALRSGQVQLLLDYCTESGAHPSCSPFISTLQLLQTVAQEESV